MVEQTSGPNEDREDTSGGVDQYPRTRLATSSPKGLRIGALAA
jgi:hypothetical protein